MAGISAQRRTSLGIVASILDACQDWTKVTRVTHECNMSFRQLSGYVNMLLETDLLLIEKDHRSFQLKVSSKGLNFLKAYNGLMKVLIE